ncbi:hypothetical protein FGIG_11319 [Fasciola gigantica]|uniref:Uncharacterized protein n=1 Tax=Fasciola gigantica TaxID=46835 RepID=A0A504YDP0_FASGI|nr:hypothetical protein FGIG_11319 [Fasciola gigantica]
MVWLFIILFISINPCTNASFSHEFITMESCDIPGNDSRVNTLKGKLFEGHFRNNASFYFSICGLSSNLSGEVFLAGYSDGFIFSSLATTISEVQKSPFEEFGFIAILSGISTSVYAYLRCGHIVCTPVLWFFINSEIFQAIDLETE